MTVGERVRWARQRYFNGTWKQLAHHLGVTPATYIAIEKNTSEFTIHMARTINRHTQVKVEWLMHGTIDGKPWEP